MKLLIAYAIIFTTPFVARAQFDFVSDSTYMPNLAEDFTGSVFQYPPHWDLSEFQVRFWTSSAFLGQSVLIMNYAKNHQWSFHRASVHGVSIKEFELDQAPDLDAIWEILIHQNVLSLPDQDNAPVKITEDGKTSTMPKAFLRTRSGTDGSCYTVELISADGIRGYTYCDPIQFSNRKGTWIAPEHDNFDHIRSTLYEAFELKQLMQQGVLYWKTNR